MFIPGRELGVPHMLYGISFVYSVRGFTIVCRYIIETETNETENNNTKENVST